MLSIPQWTTVWLVSFKEELISWYYRNPQNFNPFAHALKKLITHCTHVSLGLTIHDWECEMSIHKYFKVTLSVCLNAEPSQGTRKVEKNNVTNVSLLPQKLKPTKFTFTCMCKAKFCKTQNSKPSKITNHTVYIHSLSNTAIIVWM